MWFEKLMLKLGYQKVQPKAKRGRKPGSGAGVKKPRKVKASTEPAAPPTTPYPGTEGA